MKAARNKTIDFDTQSDEGKRYLSRCVSFPRGVSPVQPVTIDQIENKIILGDCFEVMPLLPRGFVNLLVADPPYNMDKDFSGERFQKMRCEEYEAYTERWVCAAEPLLTQNASVYVCSEWRSSSAVEAVLKRHFVIQNRITWQREKGRGSASNWKNSMEDIWFATKSKDYVFNADAVKVRRRVVAPYRLEGKPKDWQETSEGNFRDTYPSNFWDDICVPYWSMAENTAHPTQKSEKLLAKLILASSNEGDVVFDPFLGSGTTAAAAQKLSRRFVGIEQSSQYCAWAQKRLELANADKTVQGFADGVFWERNSAALQGKHRKKDAAVYKVEGLGAISTD